MFHPLKQWILKDMLQTENVHINDSYIFSIHSQELCQLLIGSRSMESIVIKKNAMKLLNKKRI